MVDTHNWQSIAKVWLVYILLALLEHHKKTLDFFFSIYSGCTSMITIKPIFSKMSVEQGLKLVASKIMSSEKVRPIIITRCAAAQAKLLVVNISRA